MFAQVNHMKSFFLKSAVVIFTCAVLSCGGPRVVHDEWQPGVSKRHGTLIGKSQEGLWTYWHKNGTKSAEGFWYNDKQDGAWTWWYDNGAIQQSGNYQGRDIDLSNRSASPRTGLWRFWHRSGFMQSSGHYQNDRQVGVWNYFDPAGKAAVTGYYTNGIKDGAWTWFHANGTRKESGNFAAGIKIGEWSSWSDNGQLLSTKHYSTDEKITAIMTPPAVVIAPPPPVKIPTEFKAVAEVPAVVPVMVTQVTPDTANKTAENTEPAIQTPTPVVKAQEEIIASSATIPLSPTVSSPSLWTPAQEGAAAKIIEKYTSGTEVALPAYEDKSASGTDDRQRRDLLDKPLVHTRFFSATEDVLDINDLRKNGPVLIVFLRGFSGQVCLYCAAQTTALANAYQRFRDKNITVVVVYPGPIDAVPNFIAAVQSLRNEPPPMPVVLDVSLIAVRALGIEDNLAKPTTLFVDKKGNVRYAYEGKNIADRPAVNDLLDIGARLSRE
jgi:antitoxin component YwqK of YwqJK toxin-antitoxin module/peroxiredoxin